MPRRPIVIMLALTAALVGAQAAGADELSDRRAQAAAIVDDVEQLEADLAATTEELRIATDRRSLARARVAAATLRLHALTRGLRAGEASLARVLVEAYKGEEADTAAYVLASGSFDELVTRMDLLDRLSDSQSDLLRRIAATRETMRDVRRQRAEAARAAAAEVQRIGVLRGRQAGAVSARRELLSQVRGRVAELVAAERARRAEARRAAAAAAAEAVAAADAPPAPVAEPAAAPAAPAVGGITGLATWYGPGFEGATTASGEPFSSSALAAAHRTLGFGTRVQVTNLATGASVVVRINDRGPFSDAIIDLTPAAASAIGMSGTTEVRLVVLS